MGCLWKLCVWDVDLIKLKQSHTTTTSPSEIRSENVNHLKLKMKILSKSFKYGLAKDVGFVFLSPKQISFENEFDN